MTKEAQINPFDMPSEDEIAVYDRNKNYQYGIEVIKFANVVSVQMPYFCPECGAKEDYWLVSEEHNNIVVCKECGNHMEYNDKQIKEGDKVSFITRVI